jgi:hypothetical protein
MFSECCDEAGTSCSATEMFPQFTIYDSMKVSDLTRTLTARHDARYGLEH